MGRKISGHCRDAMDSRSPAGEENARGSVSRVLSTGLRRMGDHSSRTGLAPGLQQSTRTTGRSSPCAVPIRSCSRWGLPCRSRYRDRGALLPHPFGLARNTRSAGRSAFCGTVPGVAPAGRYPAPSLLGARTFLPTPHKRCAAIARPSGGALLGPVPLNGNGARRDRAGARTARRPRGGAAGAAGCRASRHRRSRRSPRA